MFKQRSIFIWLLGICFLLTNGAMSPTVAQPSDQTAHPRLWLTPARVEQLRGWANAANPLWEQLLAIADEAAAAMDTGAMIAGDLGGRAYEEYPLENYAMLFAFMAQVHPDAAQRDAYGGRARALLMTVISQAAQGVGEGPFRDPEFATADRSRWYGVGYPLTVDWIYPYLSAEDKALIRTVFLRWCEENRYAATTNYNHPEPIGAVNDPVLVADRSVARWSNNNYYTAHMRNMGMMALSFDAQDDPDGALRAYLTEATGAWLYVVDHMMRTDIAGGLGAEGFEYSPQTMGYVAQFLLALHTAGAADPARYGDQVTFEGNPFWGDAVRGYLHSLSPQTVEHEYLGQVHLPAWYGSAQDYFMPDHISLFGALGSYTQDPALLNTLRWIQLYTAPGGEGELLERMDHEQFDRAILYFMLFDPTAPAPTDPRADLPLLHYAPGMRRLLARTDWSADATWFTYNNSWQTIDHQSGNANAIEFYRGGEWLTKVRVGYDLDYQTSENQNSLSVENLAPEREAGDWRMMVYERGSQWLYVAAGDPAEPVITQGDDYLTVYGDATHVYNSANENVLDALHVSRSIVWLMPDVLVVYDQAVTQSAGFKHFSLNLIAPATTSGSSTTMISPLGQQFVIHTLLPVDAALSVIEVGDEPSATTAHGDLVRYRFSASAPAETQTATFLHVLVGADAGAALPSITLLTADPAAPAVQIGERIVRFNGASITVEG